MRSDIVRVRMMPFIFALCILSVVAFAQGVVTASQDDRVVHLTILHLNDVYEIQPVSGGKLGGMARVATLKKQLLEKNPNTYTTFSGDLYGPSGLSNVAIVDGQPLGGKQSVAVMNKIGIDHFIFGDHEFDQFSADQVLARLQESQFPMISSNIFDADGKPFANVAKNAIFTAANKAGATVRVGIFGITNPFRSNLQVTQIDRIPATAEQVAALEGQVGILIAMTHFPVAVDIDTAKRFPQIDLILGGDDHEHMKKEPGKGLAPIYKSDSNARNVQIIDLFYDTASGELRIEDRLQPITDAIPNDSEVLAEVDKWVEIGFKALRQQGIKPERVVARPKVDLDGFASSIRNRQTALTRLILRGISATAQNADLSLLISGNIRLDDLIFAGSDFTEYDVVRTFPNDFAIVSLDAPGITLQTVLELAQRNAGTGGFILSTDNVTRNDDGIWLIDGQPIDPDRTYRVGGSQTLASGLKVLGAYLVQTHDTTLRQVLIDQLAVDAQLVR
ncbi:Mannosylglucosyl-3-phosphoglycerate phosphatase [Candidatus Entotheonellaceae bacterium PAL068K]